MNLSANEHRVLALWWSGSTVKESAAALGVCMQRVTQLRAQVRRKFEAATPMDLMRKALKQGVLAA